jgi:hypothetical protein
MKTDRSSRSHLGIIIAIVVVVLMAGAGVWWWYTNKDQGNNNPTTAINSYEECAAAGYPIREIYPEQCVANGKTFVRDISGDTPITEYISPKGVKLVVTTPVKNATVSIPFTVSGQVPGNWSFEASFPIELLDANGNSLTRLPAQLTGDWMTTDLVPFTLTFDDAKLDYTGAATIVLHKDNPSGLPENDDSVSIKVTVQ